MNCLICKSKLLYESDFDARECGFDADGTVTMFSCSNQDCELVYELIELIEPENGESEDFYIYGESYIKFYDINAL